MPIDVETELLTQRERIAKLETAVASISTVLARIEGSVGVTEMLLKWVVLPLIIIVGGVVGVKLIVPGT